MTHYTIILNPTSGRGNGERQVPFIEQKCRELGLDFDLMLTERPGHALELARAAAARGVDVVVSAGGDGTANEVILMKSLSWTRLFNLLEKVVPYEVKTVAIRPTFGPSMRGGPDPTMPEGAVPVAIQGIAQSLEAFLELERSLLMDAHFDQVEPEKTDVVEGGSLAFEVRFLYFPDGRTTRKAVPDLPHVLEAAGAEPASPNEPLPEGTEEEAAAPAAAPPAAPAPSAAPGRPPATPKPAQQPARRAARRVGKGRTP